MKKRVDQLLPGDRVDLEGDIYADPNGERVELIYEYETVETVERELLGEAREPRRAGERSDPDQHRAPDCVVVYFESGYACAFPPDHLVEIDSEDSPCA